MSWDLKNLPKSGKRAAVRITSFFGGQDTGRCLQLTQTEKQWDGANDTQFISINEEQADELVKRIQAWRSGEINEFSELSDNHADTI